MEKVLLYWSGLTLRIEADAPISDIEIIKQEIVETNMRSLDDKLNRRVTACRDVIKFDKRKGLSRE